MHCHSGKWALFDACEITDQFEEMDVLGVRTAVISALPAISGEIRRGNASTVELCRRHPERFLGYAHVNANFSELMLAELELCFLSPAVRGIKVYQLGVPYDDPRFEPVWEFARARNAPVLAHTWAGNLTGFDRVAKRFPEVPFFAAHVGSDFVCDPYLDAARQARNFYLDLTYSREHTNLLEHMVGEVGADQIVWGSDHPLFSMAQQISKVLFARISDADKIKILGENAAPLFGRTL